MDTEKKPEVIWSISLDDGIISMGNKYYEFEYEAIDAIIFIA